MEQIGNIIIFVMGIILLYLLLQKIFTRKIFVEWGNGWESWKRKLPSNIRVPRCLSNKSVPGWLKKKYGTGVKRWYDL